MFSYYVNESEKCTCCGDETFARVSGAQAVCEECQYTDDESEHGEATSMNNF